MLPARHFQLHFIDREVENRTKYNSDYGELNIYETFQFSEQFYLHFDQPVITSMIEGKKIMHLNGDASFEYLPGESLVVQSEEPMRIDFPEADKKQPTRCLALVIAPELIDETLQLVQHKWLQLEEHRRQGFAEENFHLLNDPSVASLLNRLLGLFIEGNRLKDLFINQGLKELIIRLIQSEARRTIINEADPMSTRNRISHIKQYIRANLHEKISVSDLAEQACLSVSHFHRLFKERYGISPVDLVNHERIKRAKFLLDTTERTIESIAGDCGFSSSSFFVQTFRQLTGLTPVQYRISLKETPLEAYASK